MSSALKDVSAFGQAALDLDHDFLELERLSGQIDRLALESEGGLDRAKALLIKFTECGERISVRVQGFSKTLDEARGRAEAATRVVADRAVTIQKRQEESNQMASRFHTLSERVGEISASLKELKRPADEILTEVEKCAYQQKLIDVDSQLGKLIEETQQLRADAQQARMKTLERNADSLSQTMQSARRKIGSLSGAKS